MKITYDEGNVKGRLATCQVCGKPIERGLGRIGIKFGEVFTGKYVHYFCIREELLRAKHTFIGMLKR